MLTATSEVSYKPRPQQSHIGILKPAEKPTNSIKNKHIASQQHKNQSFKKIEQQSRQRVHNHGIIIIIIIAFSSLPCISGTQ
jgi:hypothetical protein